jgi:hypothetical protein
MILSFDIIISFVFYLTHLKFSVLITYTQPKNTQPYFGLYKKSTPKGYLCHATSQVTPAEFMRLSSLIRKIQKELQRLFQVHLKNYYLNTYTIHV